MLRWVTTSEKSGVITRKEDLRDYMEEEVYEVVNEMLEDNKTKEELKEMKEDRDWWERRADSHYGMLVDTANQLEEVIKMINESPRLNKEKLKSWLKNIYENIDNNC